MWAFCWHSLLREYGWQFFRRVVLPHPVKTAQAVWASGALDYAAHLALVDAPATVNEDPLGAGWFIRIRLDDPAAADALLDQAAYEKLTA